MKCRQSRMVKVGLGCGVVVALVAGTLSLAKTPPPASTRVANRGLVWRVEGGKVPVFLVGSFHLLRKSDLPAPPAADQAYAASEQVWFEVPPEEMSTPEVAMKLMTAGALPGSTLLKDVISAETFRKVEEWDGDPTMKMMMNKMRPWMAALTIMVLEYQKLGADPKFGIEKIYEDRAAKDKKPTAGLETVDFQIGLFSGFTEAQQDELLSQTFDELKESRKLLVDLIRAWKTGNERKLGELLDENFRDHADIRKLLLTDRNARWVKPIEELLAGDKSTMVIVGAGHLTGPDSVRALLEDKGWKLTRIEAVEPAAR